LRLLDRISKYTHGAEVKRIKFHLPWMHARGSVVYRDRHKARVNKAHTIEVLEEVDPWKMKARCANIYRRSVVELIIWP
jgi:hypothetical protein